MSRCPKCHTEPSVWRNLFSLGKLRCQNCHIQLRRVRKISTAIIFVVAGVLGVNGRVLPESLGKRLGMGLLRWMGRGAG